MRILCALPASQKALWGPHASFTLRCRAGHCRRHTAVITTTTNGKGRFSVQLPDTPDTEWAVTLTGPANYLPGGGAAVYVFSG
jgi:hypothetical protein